MRGWGYGTVDAIQRANLRLLKVGVFLLGFGCGGLLVFLLLAAELVREPPVAPPRWSAGLAGSAERSAVD